MYRVSYNRFMQLLEKSGCSCAIAEIKERDLRIILTAIEVDFTIDDEGTEHEILTVTEFYLYTEKTVLFGMQLKHENDFTIEWARRKPNPNSKRLEPEVIKLPEVDEKTKTNLEFLQTRALDACEYADTREEKVEQYAEVDDAYAIVTTFLKNTTSRLNQARGQLGDLSRVIEKTCGDIEEDDEISNRIDKIHAILVGNEESEETTDEME